jgi:histidyl-tRNA synthetase
MGIDTICSHEASKLSKQFKFADQNGIRYIIAIGQDEIERRMVVVKDLLNSSQETLPEDGMIQ